METLGRYALYIVPFFFTCLLFYAGMMAYKFPMTYQMGKEYAKWDGSVKNYRPNYPHYSSKRAMENERLWKEAQKIYGKYLLMFAGVQAIIGIFNWQIAQFLMAVTKWEDAGIVSFTCPAILFIIFANIFTEIKIKKAE